MRTDDAESGKAFFDNHTCFFGNPRLTAEKIYSATDAGELFKDGLSRVDARHAFGERSPRSFSRRNDADAVGKRKVGVSEGGVEVVVILRVHHHDRVGGDDGEGTNIVAFASRKYYFRGFA